MCAWSYLKIFLFSERADATGATGDRLKEGGLINKSLVTLGTVISHLGNDTVAMVLMCEIPVVLYSFRCWRPACSEFQLARYFIEWPSDSHLPFVTICSRVFSQPLGKFPEKICFQKLHPEALFFKVSPWQWRDEFCTTFKIFSDIYIKKERYSQLIWKLPYNPFPLCSMQIFPQSFTPLQSSMCKGQWARKSRMLGVIVMHHWAFGYSLHFHSSAFW